MRYFNKRALQKNHPQACEGCKAVRGAGWFCRCSFLRMGVCAKTYDRGCIAESFWCRFWCEDILKGMPNELSNQAFCYFLAVEESSLLVLSVYVRLMGFCAAFCSWLFTKGAISLAPSYYLVRTPLTLKANTSFEVRSVKNRKLQSRQNMFSWPSKQV